MELSHFYLIKPNQIQSPLSVPKTKLSSTPSQIIHTQKWVFPLSKQRSRSPAMKCCTKVEPKKESEQEDNELAEIGERWTEKCRGEEGIVEEMECLEREAIMGEDHGREPNDYNRRAYIFDKSNRVFQALKEKQSNSEMLVS